MHAFIHLLVNLCRLAGLPDWAALFVVVPIWLAVGIGAILLRRKYIRILKRKVAPYDGHLRYGLFFWAPTAQFSVDGIPGVMPWRSFFDVNRIRFDRVPAAGRLLVDCQPISDRSARAFRGERLAKVDKLFSIRFQAVGAPAAFAEAFLDDPTRRRFMALLQLSRTALGRGRMAEYFHTDSTPPGRVRLEIDGRTMTLQVKGHLGTMEIEALLGHAAAFVRRVQEISVPATAR